MLLLSHLRHSCRSHVGALGGNGSDWQREGKSRQDGPGEKAVLWKGTTSHGCGDERCLELDYAVSFEFYSCAVGNDSAQLQSFHSAHVAGSRGFCKLLEVAKWWTQAHYPGLDHQGTAGTTWATTAVLSQVGWSWSPFISSSLKRTWWLVFSRLNVMIYLRHWHRDSRCITGPLGET